MASSNIKLFDENKGNMLSDSEFSISNQRMNGLQTGVASSQLQNKAMYQASLVAYAIAQIMMQNGLNANDTDAVSAFVANLSGTMLQKVYDLATTAEAQAGVATGKWMSPALVKAAIDTLAAKAQNVLSDTTKVLYGLGSSAVPDDAFKVIANKVRRSYEKFCYIEFLSSTTWRAPYNIINNKITVLCCGGGGGGAKTQNGGGGGGSGYITIEDVTVTPGTEYQLVVGAGGAQGNNGGDTSAFGVIANGGKCGSGTRGGDGGAGGGGGYPDGVGGNGGEYGGGGGSSNGATGGNGGKYGGGGGSLTGLGGTGGEYGGRGYGSNGAATNGRPATMLAFYPFKLNFTGLAASNGAAGGGGGGYGGNGGNYTEGNGSGGGGGYGGNGGNGGLYGSGGGGGYGGNGAGGYYGGGGGGGYGGDGGSWGSNGSRGGGGGGMSKGASATNPAGTGGSGVIAIWYYITEEF